MRAKSDYYRVQATRTRELAERTKEKVIKATLLEVAERYDRLADTADREP